MTKCTIDNRMLSVRLYNILEGIGVSEKMRRRHWHVATTLGLQETIVKTLAYGRLKVYYCGSWYEGSLSPNLLSDIDIIRTCLLQPPTTVGTVSSPPGESCCIVSDSWTYPGYAKLQCVMDGELQFSNNANICTLPFERLCIDNAGRLCLMHLDIKDKHGPAHFQYDKDGKHAYDTVSAVTCEDLLPSAIEWMMRPRPFDWPSKNQLQKMSSMGCMLVSVRPKYSSEKADIEWRLSYTLQERLLMASLNPVQHKIYVLLKMINKDILKSRIKDHKLTSYHWKTCIMYAVEMTPLHVWIKDNLISCLMQCLKLMIRWLEFNYCPSYFTKDSNLFTNEGFSRCRLSLLTEIRKLVQTAPQFLYLLQSDSVGAVLRDGDWGRYRDTTLFGKNNHYVKLMASFLNNVHVSIRTSMRMVISIGCDPFQFAFVLENLYTATGSNNYATNAMGYILPFLHLHTATCFASLSYSSPDEIQRRRLAEQAEYHFKEARGTDLVNERLAMASNLLKTEQYNECYLVLQNLELDFTEQVHTVCPCGSVSLTCMPISGIHGCNVFERIRVYMDIMSLKQYMLTMTASCVIFLPSAMAIAPDPLQLELFRSVGTVPESRNDKEHYWFDWIVVDPLVYLYFLKYLVSSKLKLARPRQEARLQIIDLLAIDNARIFYKMNTHKDTAYNLLGWIHMQEQRLAEAFLCFAASWKIRPDHNAAKFHMVDWLELVPKRHPPP